MFYPALGAAIVVGIGGTIKYCSERPARDKADNSSINRSGISGSHTSPRLPSPETANMSGEKTNFP